MSEDNENRVGQWEDHPCQSDLLLDGIPWARIQRVLETGEWRWESRVLDRCYAGPFASRDDAKHDVWAALVAHMADVQRVLGL